MSVIEMLQQSRRLLYLKLMNCLLWICRRCQFHSNPFRRVFAQYTAEPDDGAIDRWD